MTALVSRAALIPFTKLREDDDTHDAKLEAVLQTVTEQIEAYCGRSFEQVEMVEYFDTYEQWPGDPLSQYFWASRFPVDPDATLEIKYSATREWDTATPMSAPKDYMLNAEKGLFQLFGTGASNSQAPLPFGSAPLMLETTKGLRITYTGGYQKKSDANLSPWPWLDVPRGLAAAAAMWATMLLESQSDSGIGLESLSGENPSARKAVAVQSTLPPLEVQAMLRPYRRQDNQLRFM